MKDPQPVLLADLESADLPDTLKATVKAEGIGALAFIPLLANGELIGKFMTYYEAPQVFGETEVDLAVTIARQLGFSLERMRAEDARRRAEQELADFFENATVGLHWVGPDGTILRANRAELEMLGYGREEYVGRHIAEFHADEAVICDILRRLAGRRGAARLPGPAAVQGRLDQGRADRLQRAVGGRRVRPHPLLHPRCHRAEAGRGGRPPAGLDRRDLRRCDREQESRGHCHQLEQRGRTPVRLHRRGDRSASRSCPSSRRIATNEEPEILERIRRGERVDHYETVRIAQGRHV